MRQGLGIAIVWVGLFAVVNPAMSAKGGPEDLSSNSSPCPEDMLRWAPGAPDRWMSAYCQKKTKIDNLDSPEVQACLTSARAENVAEVWKMNACHESLYWKKRMCGAISEDPQIFRACLNTDKGMPLVVQQGLGK